MKSNSNIKPSIFLDLGDGNWHYNYNITVSEKKDIDNKSIKSFDYDTVVIKGKPDYDKIVEAVLRNNITESEEFSIINKYNAYQLGLLKDDIYKTNYMDYLKMVIKIKDDVKTSLDEYIKA